MLLVCAPGLAQNRHVLVVHGGAGTLTRAALSPAQEAASIQGLREALRAGDSILRKGGSAVDAVEAAVRRLEDNPLFNAGKGSVFTHEGTNEMDASIMEGKSLKAGAVAGLKTVKNPITAARAVMDHSSHVLLAGPGADSFAADHGCELVSPRYFFTEPRWRTLLRARKADSLKRLKGEKENKSGLRQAENRDEKYGTVGAVAPDIHGNLAAATSTGGMTNKRFGRIGDSPLIGAGTYADNQTCAVSCTGWGEYFNRLVLAKTVSDRMELAGESLEQAAREMILRRLPALGGDGGLIGVDKQGNIVMIFNTTGMYRGTLNAEGKEDIRIFAE